MKTFLSSLIIFTFLGINQSVFAQNNLDLKTFVQKLKSTPDAQLLDVRTPKEWSEGKINTAQGINVMDDSFKQQVEKLDKDKPVFVYCKAGSRSAKASKVLKEAGFKHIYNLEGGGYADLVKEGLK
ncbi:MAG: rhodanese-like domain-containing protein [Runella zeae]